MYRITENIQNIYCKWTVLFHLFAVHSFQEIVKHIEKLNVVQIELCI